MPTRLYGKAGFCTWLKKEKEEEKGVRRKGMRKRRRK